MSARTRVQLSDADPKVICELLAPLATDAPDQEDAEDAADNEEYVKEVQAPTLPEMKEQLEGFAVFMAENPQFSAQHQMYLQRMSDKVARMSMVCPNYHRQLQLTSLRQCCIGHVS